MLGSKLCKMMCTPANPSQVFIYKMALHVSKLHECVSMINEHIHVTNCLSDGNVPLLLSLRRAIRCTDRQTDQVGGDQFHSEIFP